jgi:hypothetical protein
MWAESFPNGQKQGIERTFERRQISIDVAAAGEALTSSRQDKPVTKLM